MSERGDLDRREVLFALLAAAGAAGLGVGCGRRWEPVETGERLLSFSSYPESWAEVGRVYLAERPDAELADMVAELLRDLGWKPPAEPPRPLGEAIHEQIVADIHAGRVVEVEGWVLSATEVRLAGVAALAAAP